MTFDSTDGGSDFGDFDELPEFETPECNSRELARMGLGDLLATGMLVLAVLVTSAMGRTAGGLAGGLLLAFSVYLGLMVLLGLRIGLRNLLAARRLRDTGHAFKLSPRGWSERLERYVAAAEQHPDSMFAQGLAAQQAWVERDFERARLYAQRADKLQLGYHRMLLILMAVHWQQDERGRAQHYARRLLQTKSRDGGVRKILTVLQWPLLILPGMRHWARWMRTNQRIEEAWQQWVRWLVDNYEVREESHHDSEI